MMSQLEQIEPDLVARLSSDILWDDAEQIEELIIDLAEDSKSIPERFHKYTTLSWTNKYEPLPEKIAQRYNRLIHLERKDLNNSPKNKKTLWYINERAMKEKQKEEVAELVREGYVRLARHEDAKISFISPTFYV